MGFLLFQRLVGVDAGDISSIPWDFNCNYGPLGWDDCGDVTSNKNHWGLFLCGRVVLGYVTSKQIIIES